MKPRTLITMAIAVGCGVVAMFAFKQALTKDGAEVEQTVQVLVATADIAVGVPLDESNTMLKTFPVSAVPQGVVLDPEQVVNRAMQYPTIAGEMILAAKLTREGQTGASAGIPDGMRVSTVTVSEEDSFSNQLTPGDRVDINVTYDLKLSDPRGRTTTTTFTKTLLEYVEVFMVNGSRTLAAASEEEKGKPAKVRTVSFMVTPEQGKTITFAQKKADISLMWRNRVDDEQVAETKIDESVLDELNRSFDRGAVASSLPPYADAYSGYQDPEPQAEPETPVFEAFDEYLATEPEEMKEEPSTWVINVYRSGILEEQVVEVPAMKDGGSGEADASGADSDGDAASVGTVLRKTILGF